MNDRPSRRALPLAALSAALVALPLAAFAQAPASAPQTHYLPAPAFDTASINTAVNPCDDFYKFACGNFAANHPIPSDQAGVDQFYTLYNVNTQELNGILTKYAAPNPSRTPNQQKIGDYYAACMNTALINQKGLTPIDPILHQISDVTKSNLFALTGELQRYNVNVFLGFGEGQDFKDSSKQVAQIDQGGLGLPERDYYTRDGAKDKQLRDEYVHFIARMLTLSGETSADADRDAHNILAFETKLALASMTNTERRDPEAVYHPQTLATFEQSVAPFDFAPFLQAVHAPTALPGPIGPDSLVNGNPKFFPALAAAIQSTNIETLRAYMRFHTLSTFASQLPHDFDAENFTFYGRELEGTPTQRPRWKRCSSAVDNALGEALGQVYVEHYFAGNSKQKTLQMVHDIEAAMDQDLDTLDWMSPATKVRAKEKLRAISDKIGYPDKWRDYSKLIISPTDALGNDERATAFENDRELNKIGKPVDKSEWGMTPPTVNAYYNDSMNDINFPAGILQPPFYDPSASLAVNYGHIGAVIGHELTHGFDDEGKKFDAKGDLDNWWTADDTTKFEARTGCLVHEYGSFVAVPGATPKENVMVNGKLTLGENTADNGGLVLAYIAYLDRAKKDGIDIHKKINGYTGPQRFYIAFAQNWCENSRPAAIREQVLTDPHSPDHFRANGAIVNQPGFAPAFGCKKGSPMVPDKSCRVW
ncbi:MAG: M13 family metallopeptidase [Acidobacteriaceae bacterium]